MGKFLQILIVEDSEDDTLLLIRELKRGGYDPRHVRVDTEIEMNAALDKQVWDIIIADYSMPNFGAMDALALVNNRGLKFPFMIVSGAIGEDVAVAAMKAGAHDYFMKSNLARLVPAIDKVLQEETIRQVQKLESLGVVASGIAHDFNNLLQVILSQSSLALAVLPSEDSSRKYIERVVQAGKSAANLTYQLLAYSGRGQFRINSIDINDFVQENLHLLNVAVPKNIEIESNFCEPTLIMNGDSSQIQQVIMNLIMNAAESYNGRSGKVLITTSLEDVVDNHKFRWKMTGDPISPGQYVKLEIVDHGSGMDEYTLSRIFDPYFTTKFTGRGLGLAAVIGIIRGHNGGIHIKSEEGVGTSFIILLPVADEVITTEKIVLVNDSGDAPKDRLVLVIDDDDSIRESLTDMLEIEEIKVIDAADGISGIDLYKEYMSELNLVLLDLSMPGMSGEETYKELYAINPRIPVILTSGYSESEVSERFANERFEGFLQKPYTFEVLIDRINKYMDKSFVE